MIDTSRLTIECIQAALQGTKPGIRGQARMGPRDRLDPELYERGSRDCRRAAVLFLLYPWQGELYTLLTVRPDDLPNHPGQVAFPGGSRDENETVEETALREAREEVGLDTTTVTLLGRLTHIYIPPSHFCIQIVMAYTPQRPDWRPNPAEIARLLEVPIAHFFDPANWKAETRAIGNEERLVPYFALGEDKVWGATAMALAEFVTMVEEKLQSGDAPTNDS